MRHSPGSCAYNASCIRTAYSVGFAKVHIGTWQGYGLLIKVQVMEHDEILDVARPGVL